MLFTGSRVRDLQAASVVAEHGFVSNTARLGSLAVHFDTPTVDDSLRERWLQYERDFVARAPYGERLAVFSIDDAICLYPSMIVAGGDGRIVQETVQKTSALVRTPGFAGMSSAAGAEFLRGNGSYETEIGPLRRFPEAVAVLSGSVHGNYYHWLVECLPKLVLFRDLGLDFAVPRQKTSFQEESLAYFGAERSVVWVEGGFSSSRIYFATNVARSMTRFSPLVRDFYAQVPRTAAPKDRIFISRGGARMRRLNNESEIVGVLVRRGFRVVDPGSMSFAEQIALFRTARVVVGPHGAGLTNVLFCSPGATLIELNHDSFAAGATCYAALADMFGLSYHTLIGRTTTPGSVPENSDFEVGTSAVVDLLDALGL